jgi:hypothetical protein
VIDIRDRLIWLNRSGAKTILLAHSEGTMLTCAALLSLQREPETTSSDTTVADIGKVVPTGDEHPKPSGDELRSIAWVTYGCMLNRLFGRAWPDQLRADDLHGLKKELEGVEGNGGFVLPPEGKLPRWMNFGRYTDYLGGRVFTGPQKRPSSVDKWPENEQRYPERCDDIFFKDPVRRWRIKGQVGFARMWRHSFNYESDEEDQRFRQHVWKMAEKLKPPP